MRGKATRPKTYTFRAQDVYVLLVKAICLALSPSKSPFSTERCTSPQEINFALPPSLRKHLYGRIKQIVEIPKY